MRLLKLQIRNFKGVPSLDIDLDGHDAQIYCQNKGGKTTIVDAFNWLLVGKDSLGNASFEIKPLDSNGNVIHFLETEVCGTFEHNEQTVELKKVYKERWTKKRGELNKELTGHQTDHFIDGVSKAQGIYRAKVADLIGKEELLNLLISPKYFSEQLPWKKQRERLIEICGDIKDEEVINSNPDLADLPKILDGKTVEDRLNIIKSERKSINQKIEGIPERIDEQARTIPELTVTNPEPIIAKLTGLHKKLSDKNAEISKLKAGGGVADIELQITKIDGELQAAANKHQIVVDGFARGNVTRLAKAQDELAEISGNIKAKLIAQGTIETDLQNIEETLSNLRSEYKTISEQEFTETTCPTCGQAIPEKDLQEAIATFNLNKSKKLERNIEFGKANAAKKKDNEKLLAELLIEIETEQERKAVKELAIESLRDAIDDEEKNAPKLEDNKEYQGLVSLKESMQKKIESLSSGNNEVVEKAEQEKAVIEAEIKENDKLIAAIEQSQSCHDRIAELKAEHKRLAAAHEKLTGDLFIIEKFEAAKASLLEEKVSNYFNLVNFKLFSEQINGGLTPTCIATVDGVPWGSLNSASRVHAGLDIINTLSAYYQLWPVIFIDNRESVTELPEMKAQVVSLVVSPADKVLRVETLVAEAA